MIVEMVAIVHLKFKLSIVISEGLKSLASYLQKNHALIKFITELIKIITIYCSVNINIKTKGKYIMEFIVISLFIIIVVAWFSLARDLRREDRKRETMQKIFEDGF